ncbi:MAG: glutamate--cysteine ligase [Burkholderiales bacterium RIFCSPLOWO2_02_FULL_57_36]|nr:MAG: glutamate--cysteine ligase [Burkholderiales bacterium RIFCSPLOWO2_02_FULL_57_36]
MSDLLSVRLALLSSKENRAHIGHGLRGIERETLRVTMDGSLAMSAHPPALGSALTHPQITTDYSESLLEFITPAEHDPEVILARLDAIHRFTYAELKDELLWSQSMPCRLPKEEQIPIAWYGTSHIGMLKHVYRRGLAARYGKAMQCIAGIHYNFSLSGEVWRILQAAENTPGSARDFQSRSYVALIRNFHRYSWLLMYLFGGSPALLKSFLEGRPNQLETLSPDTLYLPYATSLRMSDLGYQNNAQAGIVPPFNSLEDYMKSLARAVRTPYPPYEKIGTRRDGEWIQINTNILQIENEYYATIRPKRVIGMGERPLEALCARGVEYIEVRCLDIDPFHPLGISLETCHFLDAFLMYCALEESPPIDEAENRENNENFSRTVKEGRRPGLTLQRGGAGITLQAWGHELLERISAVAVVLDSVNNSDAHASAIAAQKLRLQSPELTPSAKVLAAVNRSEGSFMEFALQQSKTFAADFRARPLSPDEYAEFTSLMQSSLEKQQEMERIQSGDFDQFITDYRSRTPSHLCS